jgi:hypothetical protein
MKRLNFKIGFEYLCAFFPYVIARNKTAGETKINLPQSKSRHYATVM